jgi:DNA transformation protein and related proteins
MPRTNTEFTQAKPRRPDAEFADYCCELLGSLGNVEAKRMFLGWGLSVDGLTVAVIAWNTLYLKANVETQALFAATGCKVFEHESKGVTRRMQYYTAPDSALESRVTMQPWATLAMQAAVAAHKPKKAVKRTGVDKAAGVTRPRKSRAKSSTQRS